MIWPLMSEEKRPVLSLKRKPAEN
ncbi:TPA: hypothetical protein MCW56_005692, partial [Klebsiella pneumoniae]|nr:hypothetical protein [Klebsiella pneumoniae]HBU3630924.1 hypothetical protein [Klebsiella pneumoniae]